MTDWNLVVWLLPLFGVLLIIRGAANRYYDRKASAAYLEARKKLEEIGAYDAAANLKTYDEWNDLPK